MIDFASAYEAYRSSIFGYVLRRVKNWHVAEDLTNDVFLVAWMKRADWEDRGIEYRHWLVRVARWQCNLYWKKENRRQKHHSFYPYLSQHEYDGSAASDGGISQVLDKCHTAMACAMLDAALRKLRPRPLRAIVLRYGMGLQELEAGRRMGLGRDAYRAVRRGAEERLQQIMLGREPTWTAKNAKRRATQRRP